MTYEEEQFSKMVDTMDALLEKAKHKGTITYKEIGVELGNFELDKEQLDVFYDRLFSAGVEFTSDDDSDGEPDEFDLMALEDDDEDEDDNGR
jgi:hypothetical protein